MICNNCGNIVPDGQYTCNNCGAYVGTQQAQPVNQQGSYYGNNAYQNLMNQPNSYQMNSYAPQLGMKWYKFLIYFMLFLTCIGNVLSGFGIFTGKHYDSAAGYSGASELVYNYYDGLQTVDMIMGTLCIILGVYAIFVRFALADFKKRGPIMFISIYIIDIVMNVIYALMIGAVTDFPFFETYSPVSMVGSLFMIWVNYVYFNKRKHLFVN